MIKKDIQRHKRHKRFRVKISGTQERPRLLVRRSLTNIFAQFIDDTQSKSIFSFSTLDKQIKQKFPYAGNIKAAQFFGEVLAQKAKEKGITKIIFDRCGYLYHGRIKAFSDALRKGGLEF